MFTNIDVEREMRFSADYGTVHVTSRTMLILSCSLTSRTVDGSKNILRADSFFSSNYTQLFFAQNIEKSNECNYKLIKFNCKFACELLSKNYINPKCKAIKIYLIFFKFIRNSFRLYIKLLTNPLSINVDLFEKKNLVF